jgi:hypothetical protein
MIITKCTKSKYQEISLRNYQNKFHEEIIWTSKSGILDKIQYNPFLPTSYPVCHLYQLKFCSLIVRGWQILTVNDEVAWWTCAYARAHTILCNSLSLICKSGYNICNTKILKEVFYCLHVNVTVYNTQVHLKCHCKRR